MQLNRRTLASLAPAALLAAGQDHKPGAPKARTVILIRHAETGGDTRTDRDPELSEAGEQRAADLASLLGHAGVTHLFSSEYKRTQATLAPLGKAAELEVQVISARDPEAQIKALDALPEGSIAVLAGHSNTVPALVGKLGGTFTKHPEAPDGPPTLLHDQYSRLFVLAGPSTLELRY